MADEARKSTSRAPLALAEPEVTRGLVARLRLTTLLRRVPERPVWALFMFINGFVTIALLALVAMVSHTPFIFPSLGPTAFLFFFTPTQVATHEAPRDRAFRMGGLVEDGSVTRENDGLTVHFRITDTARTIPVTYTGILPDLFREGKGVVAQGKLGSDGVFKASEVLAKHDENYMPPEAAHALSQAEAEKAAKSVVSPGSSR